MSAATIDHYDLNFQNFIFSAFTFESVDSTVPCQRQSESTKMFLSTSSYKYFIILLYLFIKKIILSLFLEKKLFRTVNNEVKKTGIRN